MLQTKRGALLLVSVAVLAHIGLSVAHSLTQRPWSDEGAMACPAYDLLTRGSMGTTLWEEAGSAFVGVNRHTYYIMPLHPLMQAAWYRFTGVSLVSMRLLSLFWALVALAAWFLIMRRLFDLSLASLTVSLIALDYFVLTDSSFGRMDMMSVALGFSGIAAFVVLRERHFTAALLASNTLVAAAVFTHPMAIVHFFGLVFLTLYWNRRGLRAGHVALAAAPYLAGGLAWGLYILRAPADFAAQFAGNANYMGRLHALTAPWIGVVREIAIRYGTGYGLGPHTAGHTGPIFLKSAALLAYLTGFAGCLLTPSIRRDPRCRIFLILTPLYFLAMSVIDGTKNHWYLAHITPLLAACLAIWAYTCAERKLVPQWLLAMGLCGVALVQAGGIGYRIYLNSYSRRYQPVVAYLKQHMQPDTLIFASSAYGFDFGMTRKNLIDDTGCGYLTGRRAEFIVVDEIYADDFAGHRKDRPAVAAFVDRLLQTDYRVVYDRNEIAIYQRIDSAPKDGIKPDEPRLHNTARQGESMPAIAR
jgi:4-amino-4-deoxy-L-arabinose transferase-like glycosyltransferase